MKHGILAILFLCIACCAQEMRFVYPGPTATAFVERSNLVYKQSGQGVLALDLFLPAGRPASSKPLPVFIIFNGFGGPFMRTSPQSRGWAKVATAHGFAAITAETTPEHAADDLDSLVLYLSQHAKDLHVDPERLVVIAWSGNVSAGLPAVEDPRRKAIKAAIIYYGWADVPQVRLDLPVLFVRAGLDQPLTNKSFDRNIAAGMAANAPWTVLNDSSGHHGFDVLDDNDMSRTIIEETLRFAQNAISDSYRSAFDAGLTEASAAGALATENYARAAALYRELVSAHPQNAVLVLAYGSFLTGAGQDKEARAQF